MPPVLEAAVQSLKLAAREAVERTVESLGLAALAASSAHQRDEVLAAQFDLNRKSAIFALTFNEAFDEKVLREVTPQAADAAPPKSTSWDALSLVDDSEVEQQIAADRFAAEISARCEWELRELDTYVGSLLGTTTDDKERNPLRPAVVGRAMMKAIDAVNDSAGIRRVLRAEIGRSLAGILRSTYADIVADMRRSGVAPLSLAVRQRASRSGTSGVGGVATDFDTLGRPLERAGPRSAAGSGYDSHHSPRGSGAGAPGPGAWMPSGTGGGTPLGAVDPALMTLMRHLAQSDVVTAGGERYSDFGGSGSSSRGGGLANVIRVHRDELRQASRGGLDHMVIDVIGTLFDQILADPKVPPQIARQIARLQVPVLRTALGDPSFFATRKHPVRRFVNRIASIGAAFDTFGEESVKAVVAKVRELVQEVVEGDFDQIETYDHKLRALETFCDELARQEMASQHARAAELLAEKEDELRLRALYAEQLEGDLKTVAAPEFVREFISRVWSQVLLRTAEIDGPGSDRLPRLRRVGSELILSVQPKPTPAHRKQFLAELPKLMHDLTEGMNLVGWPEADRREFFGRLMPAHAEALKHTGIRQLDLNLMARQVQGALDRDFPSRDEVRSRGATLPVLTEEIAPAHFTPEEAEQVGLVEEAAVDWKTPVTVDPLRQAEEAELARDAAPLPPGAARTAAPALDVLPAAAGPEAAPGRALADSVQIGFAYQMHLDGHWHKVRLAHVSPGRNFFAFTLGQRHKRTISLTYRMLLRMCETGRLRSFEAAELLDRATARARRQLAGLGHAPA